MDTPMGSRLASDLPALIPYGAPLKVAFNDVRDRFDLSFMEAMAPITDQVIPEAEEMARHTLRQAFEGKRFGQFQEEAISEDHLAAIMKYCAEDTDPALYKEANSSCYNADRSSVNPFKLFLWLLLRAMASLQPYLGTIVHRGVKLDLCTDYPEGREFTWQGFTSTTKNVSVLSTDDFLGDVGPRTIFTIELTQRQARDISAYSPLAEGEILLPLGSRFRVISSLRQVDLTIVHLLELPSEEWILELPRFATSEALEEQLQLTQRNLHEAQQQLQQAQDLEKKKLSKTQARVTMILLGVLACTIACIVVLFKLRWFDWGCAEHLASQEVKLLQTQRYLDEAHRQIKDERMRSQEQLAEQEARLQHCQHRMDEERIRLQDEGLRARLASQESKLQQTEQRLHEALNRLEKDRTNFLELQHKKLLEAAATTLEDDKMRALEAHQHKKLQEAAATKPTWTIGGLSLAELRRIVFGLALLIIPGFIAFAQYFK